MYAVYVATPSFSQHTETCYKFLSTSSRPVARLHDDEALSPIVFLLGEASQPPATHFPSFFSPGQFRISEACISQIQSCRSKTAAKSHSSAFQTNNPLESLAIACFPSVLSFAPVACEGVGKRCTNMLDQVQSCSAGRAASTKAKLFWKPSINAPHLIPSMGGDSPTLLVAPKFKSSDRPCTPTSPTKYIRDSRGKS
ncbi:hypothetical protein VFPPC_15087 [Pochonia chlamydosporia 170]|uniref:Uncharacterized protein n=1 Tax=Pochonia chlamydosporia 170 TaxID=1380566 RepID=A0A179G309_METCM|nr:hypothetical protein VFPPC_15087 [Pochonia chlamydosporia 170]OAQ72236.1 hypothetical protein VFPPC_15087 [Pochonia chlamydosporia 170]